MLIFYLITCFVDGMKHTLIAINTINNHQDKKRDLACNTTTYFVTSNNQWLALCL